MKRSRDGSILPGEIRLPVEAKLTYEPQKSMAGIDNHLQQFLLQKTQLPAIPGSHRFGRQAWLAPPLSKVEFVARRYLCRWGLTQLLVFAKHYNDMFIHWEAISVLIEIWHPQTHTFIFSSFEATILIEEAELFLGLKRAQTTNNVAAHSTNPPSSTDLIYMITEDQLQKRNIINSSGIKLSKLATWAMEAKDKGLSLCLVGVFFFPNHDNILDHEFLGPMVGAWQGKLLTQAILAYLYSGLSSASLGNPFSGSVVLLDICLSLHMKMDFSVNEVDINIRAYNQCPIFIIKDALHYSDKMVIKTLHVRTRTDWHKFINDLPLSDFIFYSEPLTKLSLKTRIGQGADLRLVGSKELVLYNAHRCHLQNGQSRHLIPQLSHYPLIELRIFGTYHDQVDVRTCLEFWKISRVHQTRLRITEESELVKAYVDWIRQLNSTE